MHTGSKRLEKQQKTESIDVAVKTVGQKNKTNHFQMQLFSFNDKKNRK